MVVVALAPDSVVLLDDSVAGRDYAPVYAEVVEERVVMDVSTGPRICVDWIAEQDLRVSIRRENVRSDLRVARVR